MGKHRDMAPGAAGMAKGHCFPWILGKEQDPSHPQELLRPACVQKTLNYL